MATPSLRSQLSSSSFSPAVSIGIMAVKGMDSRFRFLFARVVSSNALDSHVARNVYTPPRFAPHTRTGSRSSCSARPHPSSKLMSYFENHTTHYTTIDRA